MIVLLIVVMAGILLYGYFLMRRLDQFIERGGFAREPDEKAKMDILLYGEPEMLVQVHRALTDAQIRFDVTDEPEVPDGTAYRWIAALSKDDERNLLVCLAARRKNASIRTMAKCNDRVYEEVFRQTGITVVLHEGDAAQRILACLKG
jgi:hypothetical protein